MEFGLTQAQRDFQQEVIDFCKAELPPDWTGYEPSGEDQALAIWPFTRQMTKKLAKKGWLTMSWPKEYGGMAATATDELIYREQIAYHRVPGADSGIGAVAYVGPTIIIYGSEAQKRDYLPRIASGDMTFCTGYSEPGAGSDLAGIQVLAIEDGDDFVVNGTKCWTSGAHVVDWCWLLARTDPKSERHRGLSLFVVDMHSPGITVVPRISMLGNEQLNDVVFEDVRVPKENLVGELNRGWYQVMRALEFERFGCVYVGSSRRTFDDLVEFVKSNAVYVDPALKLKLADLAAEIEIGTLLNYRLAWLIDNNKPIHYEAPIVKLQTTETLHKVSVVGMEILGLYGQLQRDSKWACLRGWLEHAYCYNRAASIFAGTSEIQRNIIATRGLGLARGD